MKKTLFLLNLVIWLSTLTAVAQGKTYDQLTRNEKKLFEEHVAGGQPDGLKPVLVRRGYVVRYNANLRIPEWSAYHVEPDYLKTPKREGRFKSFNRDPDITDRPVVTDSDNTADRERRARRTRH